MTITQDLRDIVVRAAFIWPAKDGRHLKQLSSERESSRGRAKARLKASSTRHVWARTHAEHGHVAFGLR